MDEKKKRKQIKAYFFPYKKPERLLEKKSPTMIALGALGLLSGCLFFLGLGESPDTACIGFILGVGGLGLLIYGISNRFGEDLEEKQYDESLKKYKEQLSSWGLTKEDLRNRPSGQQIDTWLQEDLDSIKEQALTQKLGLLPNQLKRDPLVIYGPLFWETYGIPDDELVYVKEKPSNILRFSCYQVVVVFLTDSRVATYSCNFNFLRNAKLAEKSVEYLYRDIVSVSTEEVSTNYTLPDGKTLQRAKVFRLAVASGDRIEVVVNSPQIKDLLDGTFELSDADKNVQIIREMLRSKKG